MNKHRTRHSVTTPFIVGRMGGVQIKRCENNGFVLPRDEIYLSNKAGFQINRVQIKRGINTKTKKKFYRGFKFISN